MFRLAFTVAVAAFVLVNLGNALHKGGDFDVFLDAGARTLVAAPLYADSGPGTGITGPPAYGVFFAPFAALARIDMRAARIVWYLLNVLALAAGVWAWTLALSTEPPGRAGQAVRLQGVVWPLVAIAMPAQTNFEHQNMNALLLALEGGAALSLARRREASAGLFIGVAAALKAFPALLIVYLAVLGRWRAAAAAIVVAAALTATPAMFYGPGGAWQTLRDWLSISTTGGWSDRFQNQSLYAMSARIAPAEAYRVYLLAAAVLLAVFVVTAVRGRSRSDGVTAGLAFALACAVLLSPIAWDHYWVLMFPAMLVVFTESPRDRWLRIAFWIAAILVTGLSPPTIGRHGFNVARLWSSSTLAGLVLVAALTRLLGRARRTTNDAIPVRPGTP